MLRAELDEMRAMADEARKTNQLLHAYIEYILKNQYQWQREAERLSSLMKQRFHKPDWSLFSRRARPNGGLQQPHSPFRQHAPISGQEICAGTSKKPSTHNTKIVRHERFVHAFRRLILYCFGRPPGV